MKSSAQKKYSTPPKFSIKSIVPYDQLESDIMQFVDQFMHKTSDSLNVYETLFRNAQPQICLRHNNVLTLYCEKDRTPMCVSCLYHSTQHKSHKVIPLKNAGKSIVIDTQQYTNKLQRRIEKIEDALRIGTENLVKIERIYPELCDKIEASYRSIHNLLHQKESEQIKELYLATEKLRMNHLVMIEEYNKLLRYFVEKGHFHMPEDEDLALFRRNVLSSLVQEHKYVQIDIKPLDYFDYPQANSSMYKQIQRAIIEKCETKKFPQIVFFGKKDLASSGFETSRAVKENPTPPPTNLNQTTVPSSHGRRNSFMSKSQKLSFRHDNTDGGKHHSRSNSRTPKTPTTFIQENMAQNVIKKN